MAAITTIGAAEGNVFFATKTHAAIATGTSLNFDYGFINKAHDFISIAVGMLLHTDKNRRQQSSSNKQKSPDNAGLFHAERSDRRFYYRDVLTLLWAFDNKLHHTVRFGEQGVIAAQANVLTRMKTSAALTNDNSARLNLLTTVNFYTQSFCF
jgi:hypothetical protein